MQNKIEQECKNLLLKRGIDLYSSIDFDVNGEIHSFTFQEIIEIYMKASYESQLVFFSALQKSSDAMGEEQFFEGMGKLLLMSHLSEKML